MNKQQDLAACANSFVTNFNAAMRRTGAPMLMTGTTVHTIFFARQHLARNGHAQDSCWGFINIGNGKIRVIAAIFEVTPKSCQWTTHSSKIVDIELAREIYKNLACFPPIPALGNRWVGPVTVPACEWNPAPTYCGDLSLERLCNNADSILAL
jgi:hypothetical protein